MIKQAPGVGRIAAMVAFALSCVGMTIFLWMTFGGPMPLTPESYRFSAAIPEAPTLAVEADVRIAGVDVGKVKKKELDRGAARTLVEVELEPRYAPIPRDTRVVLRQKTLLGENYLELIPGRRSAPMLADGGRLPDAQVEETTELDEIFSAFDRPTQRALATIARESARGLRGGRSRDLNDALGNLAGMATDGEALLRVLNREDVSLRRLVRNGGTVFGALNERRGAMRELVVNADATLAALASQDDSLAQTVQVLPTFLDEARTTVARLERSALAAAPLIRDLKPVADDLRPTVRDLGDLAPNLELTFRRLNPLIDASRRGVPALERTARGARPVVEAVHPFAQEFNPIVSMLGFYQQRVASFLANGGAPLNYTLGGEHAAANTPVVDPRSFTQIVDRPEFDRGNTYLQPNVFNRVQALGAYESQDCSRALGRRGRYGDVRQNDAVNVPFPFKVLARRPACFVAGPSLYDGRLFNLARFGHSPRPRPPRGTEGEFPIPRRP